MSIDIRVETPLSPEQAWRAVTEWTAHTRHVPFTSVVVTRDVGGLGDEFMAVTRLGPLLLEDPMVVTGWVPASADEPGTCEITKTGKRVLGGARITVAPHPGGAVVDWHEEITLTPSPVEIISRPGVGIAGRFVFGRAVRRLLADAERAQGRAGA